LDLIAKGEARRKASPGKANPAGPQTIFRPAPERGEEPRMWQRVGSSGRRLKAAMEAGAVKTSIPRRASIDLHFSTDVMAAEAAGLSGR